jgi:DGQHR domain-containing protein
MAALSRRIPRSIHSFASSLITQGKHKFYSLTMPIDILANCCYVTSREEDPEQGFQRVLDKKRAEEIADYLDNGLGVIPNSIVLSAQKESNFLYDGDKKTISFKNNPKAFLVLDGQHRVYGFKMTKTNPRVPVVIFNELTRTEEARLFIDINTKQRPVSNELLLDIKQLAEYETHEESYIRDIYDSFRIQPDSCLKGLMSPASRIKGKISRVTFRKAIKPILRQISENDAVDVFTALNLYLQCFKQRAEELTAIPFIITYPVVLGAAFLLFPEVSNRVIDKYSEYTADNYLRVLKIIFTKIKPTIITRPGNSSRHLYEVLADCLKQETLHFNFGKK